MQPFVAVGLKLKEYGHRVRVATHSQLRSFVEQFGLEFYPLGGDPQVLADFAVQSKGAAQSLSVTCIYLLPVPILACPSQRVNCFTAFFLVTGLNLRVGVFPRGLGQVQKVRQQIKAYVAGQLAACTEADPDHPDLAFKVGRGLEQVKLSRQIGIIFLLQ